MRRYLRAFWPPSWWALFVEILWELKEARTAHEAESGITQAPVSDQMGRWE